MGNFHDKEGAFSNHFPHHADVNSRLVLRTKKKKNTHDKKATKSHCRKKKKSLLKRLAELTTPRKKRVKEPAPRHRQLKTGCLFNLRCYARKNDIRCPLMHTLYKQHNVTHSPVSERRERERAREIGGQRGRERGREKESRLHK